MKGYYRLTDEGLNGRNRPHIAAGLNQKTNNMANLICWQNYSVSLKYGQHWAGSLSADNKLIGFISVVSGEITASIKDFTGKRLLMPSKKVKSFDAAIAALNNYIINKEL